MCAVALFDVTLGAEPAVEKAEAPAGAAGARYVSKKGPSIRLWAAGTLVRVDRFGSEEDDVDGRQRPSRVAA